MAFVVLLRWYEHWARKLAGAAVFGDARVLAKQLNAVAVRALTALPPAPPPGCDLASRTLPRAAHHRRQRWRQAPPLSPLPERAASM